MVSLIWRSPTRPRRAFSGTRMAAPRRYADRASLHRALAEGDTCLLRDDYLYALADSGASLARRQDLPRQAFVAPLELELTSGEVLLQVVAVSYCWLTPEHPDPRGEQLRALAKGLRQASDQASQEENRPVKWAIFLDWGCLHQRPRSGAEEASFQRALRDASLWFAHSETWVALLRSHPPGWEHCLPYSRRGWPTFELALASLLTPSVQIIDLGAEEMDPEAGPRVARPAPLSPDAFEALLRRCAASGDGYELSFNDASDRDFVARQYGETLLEAMSSSDELHFVDAGWDEVGAANLAGCLQYTGKGVIRLSALSVHRTRICDGGVAALASTLPQVADLRALSLECNLIGDLGAAALAEALPVLRELQDLSLGGNRIGNAGAASIAAALPFVRELESLVLGGNRIGSRGAEALAGTLGGLPALLRLHLNSNLVGDAGASALAAGVPVHLEELLLGGNRIGSAGMRAFAAQLPRLRCLCELALQEQIPEEEEEELHAAGCSSSRPKASREVLRAAWRVLRKQPSGLMLGGDLLQEGSYDAPDSDDVLHNDCCMTAPATDLNTEALLKGVAWDKVLPPNTCGDCSRDCSRCAIQ